MSRIDGVQAVCNVCPEHLEPASQVASNATNVWQRAASDFTVMLSSLVQHQSTAAKTKATQPTLCLGYLTDNPKSLPVPLRSFFSRWQTRNCSKRACVRRAVKTRTIRSKINGLNVTSQARSPYNRRFRNSQSLPPSHVWKPVAPSLSGCVSTRVNKSGKRTNCQREVGCVCA